MLVLTSLHLCIGSFSRVFGVFDEAVLAASFPTRILTFFVVILLCFRIPKYSPRSIVPDLIAGITVGVMVIPQGLSFALVANVDPVYGLYVAMITSFVYFLLGSSKYLVVGPTAVLSLLVGGFTKQGASPELFLQDALLLSFLAGLILMVLSFLRLGFLTNLLSKPISVGFTAGAALLIAFSQIKHAFGIPMETPETIIVLFKEIIHLAKLHTKVNGWAVLIFILSFAYILVLKQIKYTKMVPGPLFALIMATLAAYGFDLPNRVGLNVIGYVPKGLPKPSIPVTSFDDVLRALPFSFVVAFLSFVESFTIAKPLSIKEGEELKADQELFALGVANLVGSFFSSFPAAGSFTRSAVNYSVGAKSQFAGLVSAIIVLFSVLFLTPFLKFLPFSVLAAIVMSGVINLFEFHEMLYIWKTKKRDFFVMVSAFVLTLLLGVDMGVLCAIGIHVLVLVVATIRMRVEELVDSGDGLFVLAEDDPYMQIPGIILAKVTDSLVYLNIESFMKQVENLLKEHGALLPRSNGAYTATTQAIEKGNYPNAPHNSMAYSVADTEEDEDEEGEDKEARHSLNRDEHDIFPNNDTGNGKDALLQRTYSGEDEPPAIEGEATTSRPHSISSAGSESRRRLTFHRKVSSVKSQEIIDGVVIPLSDASSSSMSIPNSPRSSSGSFSADFAVIANSGRSKEASSEQNDPVKKYPNAIVFDFSMVNAVDSSSMLRLEELRKILNAEGYSMHFAHVHSAVLEIMFRGEFLGQLGNDALFLTLTDALDYLLRAKNKRGLKFV